MGFLLPLLALAQLTVVDPAPAVEPEAVPAEPGVTERLQAARDHQAARRYVSAATEFLSVYRGSEDRLQRREALLGLYCALAQGGHSEPAGTVMEEIQDVYPDLAPAGRSPCSGASPRLLLTAEQTERLGTAFYDHFGYNEGFHTKFVSGLYVVRRRAAPTAAAYKGVRPVVVEEREDAAPETILPQIFERLAALSTAERPTYALIHHSSGVRVHAWLVDQHGVLAAESSTGISTAQLRGDLGVTARSGDRAPILKSAGPDRMGIAIDGRAPAASGRPAAKAVLEKAAAAYLPGDIARRLSEGSGRLLVLPVGASADVPYPALPLASGEVLAEKWSTVVVPSINYLTQQGQEFRYSPRLLRDAVVVGDPDLKGDPKWRWPALPGARSEAEQIAEIISLPRERLLIGPRATKAAVLPLIAGARPPSFIYFATHALSDPVNPMDGSFVALNGGHLFGREFGGNRFTAWDERHPLVVLSACQTALGKTFEGGTYGIGRALVAAGAGQVVASLWNVNDIATSRLMVAFARELADGAVPEEALRRAQLAMSKAYPDDPAAWAAFTVLGPPSTAEGAGPAGAGE